MTRVDMFAYVSTENKAIIPGLNTNVISASTAATHSGRSAAQAWISSPALSYQLIPTTTVISSVHTLTAKVTLMLREGS